MTTEPRPSIYGASIEVDDEQVALTVVTDPPSGTLRYDGHVIEDIPAGTLAAIPGLIDHVLRHLGLAEPLQITEHATSDTADRIAELEQQVISEQKGREELRRHLERITSDYQDLSANLNERVRQAEQERDAAQHALLDAAIKPAEPSATANGAIPPSEPVGAPAAPSRSAEPDTENGAANIPDFIPNQDESDKESDPNFGIDAPSAFGEAEPDIDADVDQVTPKDVRVARLALGWKQSELGAKAGVPNTTVSALECGYPTKPDVKARIVQALRDAIIPTPAAAPQDTCKRPGCGEPSIGATMGPYAGLCADHTEEARAAISAKRRKAPTTIEVPKEEVPAEPGTPAKRADPRKLPTTAHETEHAQHLRQVASAIAGQDIPPTRPPTPRELDQRSHAQLLPCPHCREPRTAAHIADHQRQIDQESVPA